MKIDRLGESIVSRREFNKMLAAGLATAAAGVMGLNHFLQPAPLQVEQVKAKPKRKEVLGFAPHWTIDALADDELSSLTTLAYFNLPIGADGNIRTGNRGYQVLQSPETQLLLEKAKKSGVELMLTAVIENEKGEMDSREIAAVLTDRDYRNRAIENIIREKKRHGMDSINVDFEYWGKATPELRNDFGDFVEDLQNRAGSRVTVSVYASSAITEHIYDLPRLGRVSNGIVIMAYDYFGANAEIVAPTAPLNGHKEGRYWYDVATTIDDFQALVPAENIILGIPQYGHAYLVAKDEEMTPVREGFVLSADPYIYIGPETLTMNGLRDRLKHSSSNRSGWDDVAKVGWWSYLDKYDIRRMVYMEDERSIAAKCDLVLQKGLGGIAFWATGFNGDDKTVADMLKQKFQ